jgi:hypothetical protein
MRTRAPMNIRLLVIVATAAALLSLPAAAAGAPRGTKVTFSVDPLTAAVSTTQPGAFEMFASNDGTSTFNHTSFVGTLSAGTILQADGCAFTATIVTCELGTLAAGASVTRLIIVGAPATPGAITMNGTLTIDAAGGNPKASSRDTFTDPSPGVIGVRSDGEFFGRWQAAHNGPLSFSTAGIGGGNGQSTTVDVPAVAADYPAAVGETNDAIVCAGTALAGFGKTVLLTVANGEPVAPYLTVTMRYDRDTASNRTPNTVGVVHQLDDGTCEFPPRDCEENEGFCFEAFWQGNGPQRLLVIEMQLPTNGRGRGF